MSTQFEQFFRDNREEFDSEEPNPKVWDQIMDRVQPAGPGGKLFQMNRIRWMAAASILLFLSLGSYYLWMKPAPNNELSQTEKGNTQPGTKDMIEEINPVYAQEVYHFTKLIELKQTELKQIEKDNPDLYRKFITDINKLDSSYNVLKSELPGNPNSEQLLEAMIQNLQVQTALLNQQLQIVQQIKNSKNKSHEIPGKSI